jgi:hypothetical protein
MLVRLQWFDLLQSPKHADGTPELRQARGPQSDYSAELITDETGVRECLASFEWITVHRVAESSR